MQLSLSFSKNNGYVVANLETKVWLGRLNYNDASDLVNGNGKMSIDRRQSMDKTNRLWADGVQW